MSIAAEAVVALYRRVPGKKEEIRVKLGSFITLYFTESHLSNCALIILMQSLRYNVAKLDRVYRLMPKYNAHARNKKMFQSKTAVHAVMFFVGIHRRVSPLREPKVLSSLHLVVARLKKNKVQVRFILFV